MDRHPKVSKHCLHLSKCTVVHHLVTNFSSGDWLLLSSEGVIMSGVSPGKGYTWCMVMKMKQIILVSGADLSKVSQCVGFRTRKRVHTLWAWWSTSSDEDETNISLNGQDDNEGNQCEL